MRLAVALGPLVLLLGCPPPPEVEGAVEGGKASIALLYPPPDTTEMFLTDEGFLEFLAVVDLNNFDFVPPNSKNDQIEGEGHWHLHVDGSTNFYVPPAGLFHEAVVKGPEVDGIPQRLSPGSYIIRAVLQNNDHIEYSTTFDCDPCEDLLEVEVLSAADDTDG